MKLITVHADTFEDASTIKENVDDGQLRLRDNHTVVFEAESAARAFSFLEAIGVKTEKVEVENAGQWPKEGTVYFHNESVDAVECHRDFDDLERGEPAYEGLQGWMREVAIKVRVHKDGDVEIVGLPDE